MAPNTLPTQPPGAISTIVVQTAEAAQTQTATHIPTETPSPTETPTRRPTATLPSPTATVTPLPSATFVALHQNFYRVRSDDTNGRFGKSTRADKTGLAWPPQVNPLFTTTNDSSGSARIRLDRHGWESYVRWLLNDNGKLFDYATGPHLAMFNRTGWPQMETLLFGNNVIMATTGGVKWGWARVVTMNYQDGPDYPYLDFQSTPWLVQKFTTVNKFEQVGLTPNGDVFYPIVSDRNLYIPLAWLEPFPSVPRTDQVVIDDLPVRVKPSLDSAIVGYLHAEQSFSLIGYAPRGSEVWGLVVYGGQRFWLMLYTPYAYPHYNTTWQMDTDPPP